MKREAAFVFTGMLLAGAFLWGCGGKPTKTPEGTVRAYINLMKAGKWKEAALLWDYTEYAKRENPDWESFGTSQRQLIIDKLAEEKAKSLEMWRTYFTDVKLDTVEVQGTQARAMLSGRVRSIDLVQVGDQWLITGMN